MHLIFPVLSMRKNNKQDFAFTILCALWLLESLKPEWLIPALSPLRPLPTVIKLSLLAIWLFSHRKKLNNIQTKLLIAFISLMFISSLFARYTGQARGLFQGFTLLLVVYLATISFADDFKKIKKIVHIILISNSIMAILGIRYGGQIPHIPVFADQNDFALLMNILIPLSLFLALGSTGRTTKIFYYILSALFISAVVVSFSRGGFVGLAAVLLCFFIYSPNKAYSLTLLSMIIIALLLYSPASYWKEIETISQGTKEATAASRVYFWKVAVREFIDRKSVV